MSSNDVAISVEHLSKRYRIGVKEEIHDTLGGAFVSWIKSPINNNIDACLLLFLPFFLPFFLPSHATERS